MKITNKNIKYVITWIDKANGRKNSIYASLATERDEIVKKLKSIPFYKNVKVKTI